ncbi:BGTF surface domain-containing protein [Halorientalis brevis]|uniref:BGTF surface domain-containing protein n=1 Tax=Halorientalis brevis TaxID=1126241 RepID=A0ABD6CFV1_9EURY|nr:BGTF surface domain-containing protein [Halorientalis brevis]
MTETNLTPALVSLLLLSLVATSSPAVGAAPGQHDGEAVSQTLQTDGTAPAATSPVALSAASEASFAEGTVRETVGDRATINITIGHGESGRLIAGTADKGYRAVIKFDDDDFDGEVSLRMNTYLAGNHTGSGERQAWSAEAGDDVERVNLTTEPLDEPIEPATYDLKVRTDGELQDIDLLVLSEPSVSSLAFGTAPGEQFGESRKEMNLTETDSVAMGDVLVATVHTQGVFGILDAQPGEDDTERFRSLVQSPNTSFSLELDKENWAREPPEVAIGRSFENDAFHVIPAPENDTVYVTMDPDALEFTDGRATVRADDRYEATFELDEDSQVISSDERVKATVQFTERSVTIEAGEEDQLRLPPTSNATVNGTTTVAPGTILNFRVRENEMFSQSIETTVQANRTFALPLNLSEVLPGANVSVSAYNYDAEARGYVRDPWTEPSEPTTPVSEPPLATTVEPTPTEADERTTNTTARPTTTENTPTTEETDASAGASTTETVTASPAAASNEPAGTTAQATTAEGPGFTGAVAGIALVGFALLVTRRREN